MILDVNATSVSASGAAEAGIAAECGAAASAAAAALLGALPMGVDLDSVAFAEALNAAGAAYLATAGEHLANRGLFAGAQNVAAATYTATDAVDNVLLAL